MAIRRGSRRRTRAPKRRDAAAHALGSPLYRPRVKRSGKTYRRKRRTAKGEPARDERS